MVRFLTFEDAVSMTNEMINYFNSPVSDSIVFSMANRFNLQIKENFVVSVTSINKNCSECSGCHGGKCTLGCYVSQESGDPGRLCYWDKALTEVVGSKLVLHEMGHVIYDQIYFSNLPEEQNFNLSEKFAQYMENNFEFDTVILPQGFNQNPVIDNFTFRAMHDSMIRVAEIVIAFTLVGIATYVIKKKFESRR